jgi:hypothetical protein
MENTYAQLVADACTDMAIWLENDLPEIIQGVPLQNHSGFQSDNQVNICHPGKLHWYPNGNYNWSTSDLELASLSGVSAQPGMLSVTSPTEVILPLQFGALSLRGAYHGTQPCMVARPNFNPNYSIENCSCSFAYTVTNGIIHVVLSTTNYAIAVKSMTISNAYDAPVKPSILIWDVTGPVSGSSIADFIRTQLPDLFSGKALTHLLSTALLNHIRANVRIAERIERAGSGTNNLSRSYL